MTTSDSKANLAKKPILGIGGWPYSLRGVPPEGPGAARTLKATADRRRRGARGGGAARTVRATAAAAVGPGGVMKYEEKTEMRETPKKARSDW